MTIAIQAFLLVDHAELVQVRFTLHLRDQQNRWMQGGCKIYMDSYMVSNASCLLVTWTIFKNHFLEVGLIQNWETKALDISQVLIYYICHVWGPRMNRRALVEGSVVDDLTLHLRACDHTTWFWKCVGTAFGHLGPLHTQHWRPMTIAI